MPQRPTVPIIQKADCGDLGMGEFKKIKDACAITGLSQYFLREGCKSGMIPCIKSGSTYYIDMDGLYDVLRAEHNQQRQLLG